MRTAIALAVIAMLLAAAPASSADEIRVEVTSIGASSAARAGASDEPKVDGRLSALTDKLTSLFAYTRYSFLGRMQTQAAFGEPSRIAVPGRFTLVVEPERFEGDGRHRIEMTVTLFRDDPRPSETGGRGPREPQMLLRTKIRLENGGTVLLGGPPIENGVLILALSARG